MDFIYHCAQQKSYFHFTWLITIFCILSGIIFLATSFSCTSLVSGFVIYGLFPIVNISFLSTIPIINVMILTQSRQTLRSWFYYEMLSETGKLVEEEEGNFALWFSYIITGAGANLVSWLLLPRNSVSVGASGAVFGLFAISVLVKVSTLTQYTTKNPIISWTKEYVHFHWNLFSPALPWMQMSWDWRKILEVLILGQFVIKRVRININLSSLSQRIYSSYTNEGRSLS